MDSKSPGARGLDQFAETLIQDAPLVSSADSSGPSAVKSRGTDRAAKSRLPENSQSNSQNKWVGKRLGHYKIMRVLGEGTMGLVLQVIDQNLKRIVALKVLLKHAKGSAQAAEVDRFLLEAQSAAAIDHPNIAQVYEINQHSGWWYIIMEFMEGGSVHDLVKKGGPIAPGRAALLFVDAARGLAAAHEAGVIHRDIKPANLMLTRRGRCKLVDFGLAKLDSMHNPFAEDDKLLVGTPDYIAPEVAHRKGASTASDIYSLGATLYAALAGEPPFTGETIEKVVQHHILTAPPDVRKKVPGCPRGVADLIRQAMAKKPGDRPNAETFAAVLQTEVAAALATDSPSGALPGLSSGASGGSLRGSGRSAESARAGGLLQQPWIWLSALAVVALALVGGVIWWVLHLADQTPNNFAATNLSASLPPPPPAAVQPAAPPTITNSIGMQLAFIAPTTFEMGSPPDEPERDIDERQFKVTLSKGFYIGTTAVTQKQWAQVMGKNYVSADGVHPDEMMGVHFIGDSFPITCVSWAEANEFCAKLGQREDKHYRLPTEAEWECACRAGTTTPFCYGKVLTAEMANIDPQSPYGAPPPAEEKEDPMRVMPVGSFPPNAWGLYDMHGNVMQWCSDWYGDYPLGSATNPKGAETGDARVVRGGSWLHAAKIARSASRWSYPPVIRTNYIGFRVVQETE